MSHRWIPNVAVREAANRLPEIPKDIGNWTSEDVALSEVEQKMGGIAGYIQRTYRDRSTGTEVSLLLVAGESGPISLHPPTVCFSGRGYHVVRQPGVLTVPTSNSAVDDGGNHVFSQADFANSAIDDVALIRVCWGWSAGRKWESPTSPRMYFASQPFLYKLYVSEKWIPNGDVHQDAGAASRFLKEAVPVINKHLAHAAGPTQRSTDEQ